MNLKVKIFECDVPNHNNRIYTTQVAEQIIEQQNQKGGELLGEIVPPVDYGKNNTINLCECSHKVSNLRIEDGFLVGEVTILPTPNGKVLEETIELSTTQPDLVNLKFIPRGIAEITPEGVVFDYKVISVDAWNDI